MNRVTYWATMTLMNSAGGLAVVAIMPPAFFIPLAWTWAIVVGVLWAVAVPRKDKA